MRGFLSILGIATVMIKTTMKPAFDGGDCCGYNVNTNFCTECLCLEGGFQLEFASISRVINHMTSYKFKCSHWWINLFKEKNNLQDFLSILEFQPMRALNLKQFIDLKINDF